jgi:ketosteroid isomerase-like protein
MSKEIVELARQATDGSAAGFFDLLDVHVVCDNRGFPLPDGRPVTIGREAVTRQYVRWWGTFDRYSVRAEEIIDAGDSVVVVIEERGRGKGSQIPFDARHTQVWTFRKRTITHIEMFRDRSAALEAVGLPE